MSGFGNFECLVAGRYLRSRRQEGFISVITWFSLIGIALGVATLIIVMSVMNGFRQELFQRVLGLNGHINLYAMTGTLNGWEPMVPKLQAVPGVRSVDPLVEGQGLLTYRGFATGVVIRGLPADVLRQRPILSHGIVAGSLDDLTGMRVLIGRRHSGYNRPS
ncbi:MAG: ABC transporter permease [Alphaproteobacteria bacterium]|nr:MAG: ABC transporter permease [Alphaproteobacteria bacterium]